MVELLAEYLCADDKMLDEMQHYQTMMGDIQDADVLLRSFDKFARKKNIRSEQANQLREELLRRREWLIKVYMDAAGQLREFLPVGGKVT
jgi:CHAD domain-containing protein